MHKQRTVALCAALLVLAATSLSAAIPERERNALIAIYNATGGPGWQSNTGWNGAPGSECDWFGVDCDDAGLSVVRLGLATNHLSGSIPPAVGELTNLYELNLGDNALSGPIPDIVGTLRELRGLDLSFNRLSGAIPASLGTLTNITSISLNDNVLTGAIPAELTQMVQLEGLWLGGNRLTGSVSPDLARLIALKDLDLSGNAFTGTIPPELGSLSHLETLRLSANALSGQIPASLGQLHALGILDLSGNALTGSIPPEIGNDTEVRELWLGTNSLTGEIPATLFSLTKLNYLFIDENELTGTLSARVGDLVNLLELSINSNALTGGIPPEIAHATHLQRLRLSDNQLTGEIPPALRSLTDLTELDLGWNKLSGDLPTWLGDLTKLESVTLDGNALTGQIPDLSALTSLTYLSLGANRLRGGIPPSLGRLTNLQMLDLDSNELGGTIPEAIWDLRNLTTLRLNDLDLSGVLSPRVGLLTNLETLDLDDNALSGSVPPQIGQLAKLEYLFLGANRFSGPIPREVGGLTKLRVIGLASNFFAGPLPAELALMTSLDDGESDFRYNALYTTDATLRDFVNRKQADHDFVATQTVTPGNVHVVSTTDRSAVIAWNAIAYIDDGGGYQIRASLSPGGAAVSIATTASKEITSEVVRNLQPVTAYYFTVTAVTHPGGMQRNVVLSEPSAPVSASTTARVTSPADVVVTSEASGLIQIDRIPQNEDGFTLTNFGDSSSSITLTKDDGAFFEVSPASFTLLGGASQRVRIASVPQAPGTYGGWVGVSGDGVGEDVGVWVTLLSTQRPAGTVQAEAVSNRIEVTGMADQNSIGTVGFRNSGTAMLTGILVAEVPWLVPQREPVTIGAGEIYNASFTVDRSRRPDLNGAIAGTLSLVYVDDVLAGQLFVGKTNPPPAGVSVTRVTVVDTAKPAVGAAGIPALGTGEVAYFIAGLGAFSRAGRSYVSDVGIQNRAVSHRADDVRMYFRSAGATQVTLATLAPIVGTQAISFANVLTSVYGGTAQSGTIQIRSSDWQSLAVNAKLLAVGGRGTFTGDIPVFRSDRGIRAGQQLFLAGIGAPPGGRTTLHLQEVSGAAARARIEYLDSGGGILSQNEQQLDGFTSAELAPVSAAAVTAVVTNMTGSAGRVVAYARVADETSGDSWSVLDWSSFYDFSPAEPMRIPVVESGGGPILGRRRAIRPTADEIAPDAIAPASTQLWLFNPATTEARVRLRYVAGGKVAEKETVVAPRQTFYTADARSTTGASAESPASLMIIPLQGRLIATTRVSRSGSGLYGSAIPVIGSRSGLRVGQVQVFPALEDSAAQTIVAGTPGTWRTSYGFAETSGAAVKVRASILLSDGRSLVSYVAVRDFALAANDTVTVDGLVKSIIGAKRDTDYGDLHDLQLRVEVTDGNGSVVPFVTMTDNASGDTIVRVE